MYYLFISQLTNYFDELFRAFLNRRTMYFKDKISILKGRISLKTHNMFYSFENTFFVLF